MGGWGFFADAASIDGSSHLLIEIAGLLHEGRLDGDTATMARAPRAHDEVGAAVVRFVEYAGDQYQDLVLLLTALATRLKAVGDSYLEVDASIQRELDKILDSGRYVAPADR